jgi:hypothetical protein
MTNQWQKRQAVKLVCPTGNEVMVRRTGPDLAVKAGKFARVLQKVAGKNGKATPEEQLLAIEQLPEKELESLMAFARVVIADVVVNPPLALHPKEGQLSPDDVPLVDFWFIHTWAMNGGPTMPVQMQEGETTVEAVETFPTGQESSTAPGIDSEQIQ